MEPSSQATSKYFQCSSWSCQGWSVAFCFQVCSSANIHENIAEVKTLWNSTKYFGSVHILRNQVGGEGGLLKMLTLDYRGGGGVSGYDDIS